MRRSDPGRGGIRLRRLLGRRGITRLASAIGPVVIGVLVAFAWNTAATHETSGSDRDAGVTPQVELTVEQAAIQAWASQQSGEAWRLVRPCPRDANAAC